MIDRSQITATPFSVEASLLLLLVAFFCGSFTVIALIARFQNGQPLDLRFTLKSLFSAINARVSFFRSFVYSIFLSTAISLSQTTYSGTELTKFFVFSCFDFFITIVALNVALQTARYFYGYVSGHSEEPPRPVFSQSASGQNSKVEKDLTHG